MLKRTEWMEPMLVHESQPCGPVPTVCDEEGIYPYVSFSDGNGRFSASCG